MNGDNVHLWAAREILVLLPRCKEVVVIGKVAGGFGTFTGARAVHGRRNTDSYRLNALPLSYALHATRWREQR